jgi:DNA (cytosine-5)-methyltransferase 1
VLAVGSLFTGCMGLDLGLEATGRFRVAWACESDAACRRIIARHRPDLVVHDDVRTLDFVDPVDGLVGGFPCQDLSYAGLGGGLEGDRSGLWLSMAAAVRLLRPRFVLVENVPGLATRGLGRVLYDLAACGYVGRWLRLRACDVGAPHIRERVFVFARDAAATDAGRERLDGPGRADEGSAAGPELGPDGRREPARPLSPSPDTGGARLEGSGVGRPAGGARLDERGALDWGEYAPAVERWEAELGRSAPRPVDDRGRLEPRFVEWMLGFPDAWTAGESRTARLRMLGNAVQVQVGELAGRMLLELEAAA